MPTFETTPLFRRQWAKLTAAEKTRFSIARAELVKALRYKPPRFPAHLRIHRVGWDRKYGALWSMSFGPDSRAVYLYGVEVIKGHTHVIWVRIGDHGIYG